MLTSQGLVLIGELIAATLFIVALAGLGVRRSKPWLIASALAFVVLIVAVMMVVEMSA